MIRMVRMVRSLADRTFQLWAQRGGAGEERRQLAEVRAVQLEEALLGLLKLEKVVSDTLRLGPSREVAIGREPEHLCFF